MYDAIDWRAGTLIDILRERSTETPTEVIYTFLVDGESQTQTMTFNNLDYKARSIAQSLRMVAKAGERVLLLYPDGLDYVAGLFGCLYAGMVAVSGITPSHPRSPQRFLNIASDSEASIVLGTRAVLAGFQRVVNERADELSLKWVATDARHAVSADDWERPSVTNGSLALLQYTSGSTGDPRGVMLSHGNLLHNLNGLIRAFEYRRDDVGVSWLPFSHDMGLIGAVLMAPCGDGQCVLMSASHFVQKPIRWLQAISRYRATISGGPNFAYDLCVRRIDPAQTLGLDLSRWRIAFNGAETVRYRTIRRFSEAFRDCGFRAEAMYPCYGLAEATLFVAGGETSRLPTTLAVSKEDLGRKRAIAAPGDEGAERIERLVGCGQSLPGQEIVIVRPRERTPCDPGEIGEIWVSGPSVAQGYYNRAEETKECFHASLQSGAGPYLRTGDLGFLLGGNLFVAGRLKDLIIIRGTNYYPDDIESTAEGSHAALRPGCSAAFCVDHDEEGLVVICELGHGHDENARNVISSIQRAIVEEHELRTDAVVLVRPGTVPKTPSGKIQRRLCREAYLEGRLTVVRESRLEGHVAHEGFSQDRRSRPGTKPETFEELERWFLEKLKIHGMELNQLRPEMHLSELHVDSLIIVALKGEIEDEFGIRIQAADLFNFPNLDQLAAFILEQYKHERPPQFNGSHAIRKPSDQAGRAAVQEAREGKGRLQYQRLLRNGRGPLS